MLACAEYSRRSASWLGSEGPIDLANNEKLKNHPLCGGLAAGPWDRPSMFGNAIHAWPFVHFGDATRGDVQWAYSGIGGDDCDER